MKKDLSNKVPQLQSKSKRSELLQNNDSENKQEGDQDREDDFGWMD